MSYQELYDWYEYYNQEPFLADRLEIQLATVCQMVGSFGGSKLKTKDFMITKKNDKKNLTKKEYQDQLKNAFMSIS